MTSTPAKVSFIVLFLSAWDLYRARISLFFRITLMIMALPLILAWAMVAGLLFNSILLAVLGILVSLAMLLTGRWTARVEEDILNGNPTTLP